LTREAGRSGEADVAVICDSTTSWGAPRLAVVLACGPALTIAEPHASWDQLATIPSPPALPGTDTEPIAANEPP
jgi:hypothetical protein